MAMDQTNLELADLYNFVFRERCIIIETTTHHMNIRRKAFEFIILLFSYQISSTENIYGSNEDVSESNK